MDDPCILINEKLSDDDLLSHLSRCLLSVSRICISLVLGMQNMQG
jgi:hypothetical protein